MPDNVNDNLRCDQWKKLPVRYLKVRIEDLLYINSANPNDPYDYSPVIKNFTIYSNDISSPFTRYYEEDFPVTMQVPSPCNDGTTVPANIMFKARHTVAAGLYGPILVASVQGVFDGEAHFFGLDQYTDVYFPGDIIPDYEYDVAIKLEDGDGVTGGRGYTNITFIPDYPKSPVGTYFFTIKPSAKIVHENLHTIPKV